MPNVGAQATPAHISSEGVINPALKIFKVPPTDISINAYRMVTIQPTTTGINPMEFIIPGLDDYVDLGRSYFTMDLRLKKSDNANLVAAEKVWPVNNLAHSMIKQIDLQLNGTLISPQSDTYHYKAYIEELLNFDREHGKTVLGPQGWFNAIDFPPQWTANNNSEGKTQLNYDVMRQNVDDEIQKPQKEPRQTQAVKMHQIVRDATTYDLYTFPDYKSYQLVYDKRVIDPSTFQTYPYGYTPLAVISREHSPPPPRIRSLNRTTQFVLWKD